MNKSLKDFVTESKSRIREISPEEAAAAIKANGNTLVLDVREPAEWADAHLSDALLLPRGMLEAKADLDYANREPRLTDRKQMIIIHCASGARSAMAADTLQQMGFSNVCSMAGGIAAWRAAGLPVVHGSAA
jgi:rhodanese-related sulfurtransferase